MTITDKINEIIDRRIGRNGFEGKGHLEVIKKKKEFFEGLSHLMDEYSTLRETILYQIKEQKGEYYVMSVEDPTFQDKVELADPSAFILQLQKCLTECERLEKRFNRDTINISVVGRAGQGKSRLLQSISGVPNDIIPADTGGDCTGAKSTIANASGGMHARIKFYTEQELLSQVQAYLDALGSSIKLGSISQVPNIRLDDVKKECGRMTSTQDSLFRHLTKYVINYNIYSAELGGERDESDPKRIRYYVAQYATGKPDEKYYAYLGVKEVTIYTEFPEADAGKIMLVDTIGLGDTSLNLEDKMMETLGNDSDAAIVVRKADPEREHVSNEDNDFYDYLVRSLGNRDIEKWLFYTLNVCEALHNTATGEELYARFNEKRKDGSLRVALLEKVDCGSQKDVRDKLLIPMLGFISENLIDIDNGMMSLANEQFADAYQKYFDLCAKMQNVLSGGFKKSLQSGGLFDELYEDKLELARQIDVLIKKYSNRDEECDVIRDEVKAVIRNIASHCPTSEEIHHRLTAGGPEAYPNNVYNYYADNLRAAVRDEFEEINRSTIAGLQDGFKTEVCEILKSEEGGRLKYIPLQTELSDNDDIKWLGAIIEEKLDKYPLVAEAFKDIYDYRLNIEGLLEFKANRSLDSLDPSPQNDKFIQPVFQGQTTDEIVELIEQTLMNAIPIVADEMMEGIKELLIIPYNSFNARVRKLNDRIIFKKDGRRELKNFYRENATAIWSEEFKNIAGKEVALGQLNDYSEKMAQKRVKDLFILKLS